MKLLILIIISGIIFSIIDIIYKNIDYNIIDFNIFTALWAFIAGIVALMYIIYNLNYKPEIFNKISYKYYFIAILSSFIFIGGYILYYYCVKCSKNTELVRSIFSGTTIIMVLLYGLCNKKYLYFHQYIGIFLILIGIFLAYNTNLSLY